MRRVSNFSTNHKGFMQRGVIRSTAVAIVDAEKTKAFVTQANKFKLPKSRILKIREQIASERLKAQTKGKAKFSDTLLKKEVTPLEFMKKSRVNSRTMILLTETFLNNFNRNTLVGKVRSGNQRKLRGAFDIMEVLRIKFRTLPEHVIQDYSNWVYSFLQKKGNRTKLVGFRNKILKGLVN